MTHCPGQRFISALLVAALFASTSIQPASAEEAQQSNEAAEEAPKPLSESLSGMARAEYAAARVLYEDGDYQGALVKLESAYKLSEDPRLLWNMAAAEKNLRHYARVMVLLDRYLEEGQELVTARDRESAEQLITTVRAFVADLAIQAEPEGVSISIDGKPIGTAPITDIVRLDMGKRELIVSKPGFVSHRQTLDLPGGQRADVHVELKPEVHEGTLRIVTDAKAVIRIDGKVVGTGLYSGTLASGAHTVHISEPGKQPHQTEVVIKDNDASTLHVTLRDEPKPVPLVQPASGTSPWWWVAGGAVLAGAGVGAYFMLRPDQQGNAPPETGTWGGFEL